MPTGRHATHLQDLIVDLELDKGEDYLFAQDMNVLKTEDRMLTVRCARYVVREPDKYHVLCLRKIL